MKKQHKHYTKDTKTPLPSAQNLPLGHWSKTIHLRTEPWSHFKMSPKRIQFVFMSSIKLSLASSFVCTNHFLRLPPGTFSTDFSPKIEFPTDFFPTIESCLGTAISHLAPFAFENLIQARFFKLFCHLSNL